MLILIPEDGTRDYTVFARGQNRAKPVHVEGRGWFIHMEGTVVLFYTYTSYRRALVISEQNGCAEKKSDIVCVKEKCGIIYDADRRKVDFLKKALYILEQEYGNIIYSFSAGYWYQITSLVDAQYCGSRTACRRHTLVLITDRYMKKHGMTK